jgi:hypothetical protein
VAWFYDSRTGAYAEEAGVLGFLSNLQAKLGLGWHQYATYADMTAAIAANHWPPLNNNPSDPIGKTAVGSAEAAGAATGITGFLGDLSSRNLWLRVAKVVVGLGLIIIGIVHLTHAQNLIATAAKGAVLA